MSRESPNTGRGLCYRHQRVDILEMLLSQCRWEAYASPRKNMEEPLREAHETKNKEIIPPMEDYLKNKKAKRKWWQFWN